MDWASDLEITSKKLIPRLGRRAGQNITIQEDSKLDDDLLNSPTSLSSGHSTQPPVAPPRARKTGCRSSDIFFWFFVAEQRLLRISSNSEYPQNFEGARLIIKKVLSSHFDVTHTITLSSVTPSGYKFGVCYVGTKTIGFDERYPIVKGDIMPNGNVTANFVHALGCRFRYKLSTQIDNCKYKAFSSSIEYRTNDYTFALTLANPNIIKQHGTIVLHFLQAITSRITLGTELACLRDSRIPGGQQSLMCVALRYNTGPTTLSATLGEAGLHVCYYKRASPQLQLGVEMETNMRTHQSIATIVYEINLPNADLIFRGIANSETSFGCVFEKRLYPIPESSLIISGLLNHMKQQFRVGVGLNIGV